MKQINKLLRWHLKVAPRFFMKTILFISLISIIIIGFVPLFPSLVIYEGDQREIVYHTDINQSSTFSIRYIHSIHLTPVEEDYQINDHLQIVLNRLSFDTYSVGMPSGLNDGEELELSDGKMIITKMDRTFPYIDLRVGQVISDHTLMIKNKKIKLGDIAKPGSVVRIQVVKLNLLQRLL